MATPPDALLRDDSGAARRIDETTPPPRRRRPRRRVREGLPARAYVLNAVAIGIAVLLIPALTRSSVTAAVPRTDPVIAPSPTVTQEPRFGPDIPPPALDRSTTRDGLDRTTSRDGLDHDDTVAPPPPATLVPTNGSGFVSPVPGAITGAFGQRFHPILHYWRMHNGVDMHAACGTVVVASYRGRVIEAGSNGGYGNLVVVDHGRYKGKQVISKYAHLSRIGVRLGERVGTGQGIALSGTTGLSTGCHLHFEIKENGGYVDPAPYLTGKKSPRPDHPIKDLGPTAPSPSPSASASSKPSADPTTASPRPSASPEPTAPPSRSPKPSPRPPTSSRPSPAPSTTPPSPTPSTPADPEPSETPTPKPTRSNSPSPPATPRESSAPTPSAPAASSQAPGPSSTAAEQASPTPRGSVEEAGSASMQRWAVRRD